MKEIILPYSKKVGTLNRTPNIPTLEITENGVYNVKGYTYADVNVEGGGSSDFTTAKVTATYTLPEGVNSVEELEFSTSFFSIIKAEDNEHFDQGANLAYGGKYLPLSLLGTVSEINVPLLAYDGYFTDMRGIQFKLSDETIFVVDITNSSVVSGDAVIDSYNGFIKVTGDCVVNLALTV